MTKAKSRVASGQSQDSVAWLRLDDLKEVPGGRGFVERLDSVHEANRLFRCVAAAGNAEANDIVGLRERRRMLLQARLV